MDDPFYIEDLRLMVKAVRYNQWLFELLRPFLGKCILEVGGGIGTFTLMLAGNAESVVCIEPNAYCFDRLLETTKDHANVEVVRTDIEHFSVTRSNMRECDTVVCMNVLEHIANDREAVEKMRSILIPGGRLILFVPAVQAAFGEIDRRVGHYRRYSRAMIGELLRNTCMEAEVVKYVNFVGLLGWFWNAKIRPTNVQSEQQISIFDTYIVPVISRLEHIVPPPIGQSLLVVARNGV